MIGALVGFAGAILQIGAKAIADRQATHEQVLADCEAAWNQFKADVAQLDGTLAADDVAAETLLHSPPTKG